MGRFASQKCWYLFFAAYEELQGGHQMSRQGFVFDELWPPPAIPFLVEQDQRGLEVAFWRGTHVT